VIRPQARILITLFVMMTWIVVNFIFYRLAGLPGFGGRYLILPLLILLLMIYQGVRYVHTAFGLKGFFQSLNLFFACMFGIGYRTLSISDGRAQVDSSGENLLLKVGGPGYVKIQEGNVVVVESITGHLRVLGPGRHFITRQQTIKECISLDERFRPIEKLSARSKDGIEVLAQDIRYRYQIFSDAAGKGSADQFERVNQRAELPFHYSEDAILRVIYNRTQDGKGIRSWEDGVNNIVESIIMDFIRSHPVDYLTAPLTQGSDPRAEINAEFYSPAGRNRFRERGAELIWIDIGHFETPEKIVGEQRVSTWQARWMGNANIMRDYAEAQEFGRAEAQSDLVGNIVQSLKSVGAAGESRQMIRAQYLARIIQIIEAMRE